MSYRMGNHISRGQPAPQCSLSRCVLPSGFGRTYRSTSMPVNYGKKRQVFKKIGGASRDRTDDLIVANDALSQLSYSPVQVGGTSKPF